MRDPPPPAPPGPPGRGGARDPRSPLQALRPQRWGCSPSDLGLECSETLPPPPAANAHAKGATPRPPPLNLHPRSPHSSCKAFAYSGAFAHSSSLYADHASSQGGFSSARSSSTNLLGPYAAPDDDDAARRPLRRAEAEARLRALLGAAARRFAAGPRPAAADLAPAGYLAARQRSVRAMRAAHRGYRLQDNTLFLAVAYFDRVWLLDRSLHAYGPAELQQNLSLIALVCLMLASKMEEVHACFALDLAPYFFAGAALDSETPRRVEVYVLTLLRWDMNPPTPLVCLQHTLLSLAPDLRALGQAVEKVEALAFEHLLGTLEAPDLAAGADAAGLALAACIAAVREGLGVDPLGPGLGPTCEWVQRQPAGGTGPGGGYAPPEDAATLRGLLAQAVAEFQPAGAPPPAEVRAGFLRQRGGA